MKLTDYKWSIYPISGRIRPLTKFEFQNVISEMAATHPRAFVYYNNTFVAYLKLKTIENFTYEEFLAFIESKRNL